MKRLSTIAVMILMLSSCNKEIQLVNARIDFAISDNSITKVASTDVHNAVEEAVHNLPVKIHYGTQGGSMTQCDAGDIVTLPVGQVKVVLQYCGELQTKNDVCFCNEPYIYADTAVTFHSYYSELIVKAHFKCALVVVDTSETDSIYLGSEYLSLADYGSFKAFYVFGDSEGATASVVVNAKEQTDFETREVDIKTDELEWGKWYSLSPTGITSGNGELNFDVDGFEEGGII